MSTEQKFPFDHYVRETSTFHLRKLLATGELVAEDEKVVNKELAKRSNRVKAFSNYTRTAAS